MYIIGKGVGEVDGLLQVTEIKIKHLNNKLNLSENGIDEVAIF